MKIINKIILLAVLLVFSAKPSTYDPSQLKHPWQFGRFCNDNKSWAALSTVGIAGLLLSGTHYFTATPNFNTALIQGFTGVCSLFTLVGGYQLWKSYKKDYNNSKFIKYFQEKNENILPDIKAQLYHQAMILEETPQMYTHCGSFFGEEYTDRLQFQNGTWMETSAGHRQGYKSFNKYFEHCGLNEQQFVKVIVNKDATIDQEYIDSLNECMQQAESKNILFLIIQNSENRDRIAEISTEFSKLTNNPIHNYSNRV